MMRAAPEARESPTKLLKFDREFLHVKWQSLLAPGSLRIYTFFLASRNTQTAPSESLGSARYKIVKRKQRRRFGVVGRVGIE